MVGGAAALPARAATCARILALHPGAGATATRRGPRAHLIACCLATVIHGSRFAGPVKHLRLALSIAVLLFATLFAGCSGSGGNGDAGKASSTGGPAGLTTGAPGTTASASTTGPSASSSRPPGTTTAAPDPKPSRPSDKDYYTITFLQGETGTWTITFREEGANWYWLDLSTCPYEDTDAGEVQYDYKFALNGGAWKGAAHCAAMRVATANIPVKEGDTVQFCYLGPLAAGPVHMWSGRITDSQSSHAYQWTGTPDRDTSLPRCP